MATLYQDIFASAAFREAFERDLLRLLALRDRMDAEADNGCQLCFKAMRRVLELAHEKRAGSPFPRSVVQLPISLDDDAFPDDSRSDNAIAFAFRQPLLELLHRARSTLLDVLQAFHSTEPVPFLIASSSVEARNLPQSAPRVLPTARRGALLQATHGRGAGRGAAGGAGRGDGGERGVLLPELVSARNGEENLQNAGGFARSGHCALWDRFFLAHSQLSCRTAASSRPSTRPP